MVSNMNISKPSGAESVSKAIICFSEYLSLILSKEQAQTLLGSPPLVHSLIKVVLISSSLESPQPEITRVKAKANIASIIFFMKNPLKYKNPVKVNSSTSAYKIYADILEQV